MLSKWFKWDDVPEYQGDRLTRNRSAKAYNRYFEGYIEDYACSPAGSGRRIVRTYIADYYFLDLPKGRRILLKLFYASLWALSAVLFGSSASQYTPSNWTWYAVVPQAGSVFFLFWMLKSLFVYITCGFRYTIGEYRRGAVSLRRSALFAAGVLLLSALMQLFYLLFHADQAAPVVLIALRLLLAATTAATLGVIDGRLVYHKLPSKDAPTAADSRAMRKTTETQVASDGHKPQI